MTLAVWRGWCCWREKYYDSSTYEYLFPLLETNAHFLTVDEQAEVILALDESAEILSRYSMRNPKDIPNSGVFDAEGQPLRVLTDEQYNIVRMARAMDDLRPIGS